MVMDIPSITTCDDHVQDWFVKILFQSIPELGVPVCELIGSNISIRCNYDMKEQYIVASNTCSRIECSLLCPYFKESQNSNNVAIRSDLQRKNKRTVAGRSAARTKCDDFTSTVGKPIKKTRRNRRQNQSIRASIS